MLPSRLEVSTNGIEGGVLVEVSGELDAAAAPHLTEALRQIIDEEGYSHVVIDAQRVLFIDAAGVRALHRCYEEIHEQGSRFNLIPSELVRRVLDLAELHPPFHLFPSVEEAVADLRSQR